MLRLVGVLHLKEIQNEQDLCKASVTLLEDMLRWVKICDYS